MGGELVCILREDGGNDVIGLATRRILQDVRLPFEGDQIQ